MTAARSVHSPVEAAQTPLVGAASGRSALLLTV